jgi:hypothetical protein
MQVFTDFIKSDLTEDQILPVLRNLLPVLLNILGSTDVCEVFRMSFHKIILQVNCSIRPSRVHAPFLYLDSVLLRCSWSKSSTPNP